MTIRENTERSIVAFCETSFGKLAVRTKATNTMSIHFHKCIIMTTMRNTFILLVLVGAIIHTSTAKRIFVKHSDYGSASSEGQRMSDVLSDIGSLVHEFDLIGGSSIEVPDDFDVSSLHGDPRFDHVEEVGIGHAMGVPNDAKWSSQWGPQSLLMDQVWNLVPWDKTRLRNISVAICDSGVDLDHPDIDASRIIWRRNYIADNYNVTDDYGHGTHVAGILAATTNNSVGIAGIAYGVNLMIGKVFTSSGTGTYDDFLMCMLDAYSAGANIINFSLGGKTNASYWETYIKLIVNSGALVVAAAGNYYTDSSNPPIFPAAFPSVFSVANLMKNGSRDSSSTTNQFVDIAAPGTGIISTVPVYKGTYASMTGTSMATPHVAGIAALLMALKPTTNGTEIAQLLQTTAIDLGTPGKDDEYGYGEVNPLQAAKVLLNQPPVISVSTSYNLVVNKTFVLNVTCSSIESFDSCVTLTSTTGPSFMTISRVSSTKLTVTATPIVANGSSNQVTFTAVDTFGTVKTVKVTFRVPSAASTPSSSTPPTTGSVPSSSPKAPSSVPVANPTAVPSPGSAPIKAPSAAGLMTGEAKNAVSSATKSWISLSAQDLVSVVLLMLMNL